MMLPGVAAPSWYQSPCISDAHLTTITSPPPLYTPHLIAKPAHGHIIILHNIECVFLQLDTGDMYNIYILLVCRILAIGVPLCSIAVSLFRFQSEYSK